MKQQNNLDIVDPKYQRTLVYGIQCLTTGEMYVGCTTLLLEERMDRHVSGLNCSSKQIIKRGNYKSYEIQRLPCQTKREALTLEGEWQRTYKECFGHFLVNEKIEGVFWRDDAGVRKNYNKGYYEEHSEVIKNRSKQYREEHKEETSAYRKAYREKHKEEMSAYHKAYRKKNKAKNKAKNTQPWSCEWCNKTMCYSSQYRHKKLCKPAE